GLYVNALIFLPAVGAQVPQGGQDVAPPASIFAFIIVATLVQLLGGLVLGIATLRARVFPVAIGWLLIASAVLAGLAFPLEGMANTIVSGVSDLLLALALSWSGYLLTKTARTAAQEVPMPARAANG
ncbi:MAG: hypothetical protein J2P36_20935, partial [Ktedonobacteraceae bacterium]|nr:hypothetical protein [Ktedonobacteraceae bacterium]